MSHNFGTTTNFSVDTTDSFWSGLSATQQTNVTANGNYLLGQVETAFATTSWFGTDTSKFGTSHRLEVLLDLTTAAAPTTLATAVPLPLHLDTCRVQAKRYPPRRHYSRRGCGGEAA